MTDLPERLFKLDEEPDSDQIHMYFKLDRINQIAKVLDPNELEVIRRTKLGDCSRLGGDIFWKTRPLLTHKTIGNCKDI